MIIKQKTKAILGRPREIMLIFKARNPLNLRHGINKGQIQTNKILKN
jgi:hypothetical protein